MVMVMGALQLCFFCHEITERTSDGDRLACAVCGRPYAVVFPVQRGPRQQGVTNADPWVERVIPSLMTAAALEPEPAAEPE
jgi:hypothetical protein